MDFGIKDLVDILLVAAMLFYLFRAMRQTGTLNIFVGVMSFIVLWFVTYKMLDMQLFGGIMDKFINMGLLILVILFQEQIKRFLNEIGARNNWPALLRIFSHGKGKEADKRWLMTIVHACLNMSRSKTGALIVIERSVPLRNYAQSGDILNANINGRLIENIFFKNSPLHDGALIISERKITSAGCILPVSHDTSLPRYLGLRHRSALGIAQETDAVAIVVSEETGNISMAYKGEIRLKMSVTDLEHQLSAIII